MGSVNADVDFDAEMRALEAELSAPQGAQTEPKGVKTDAPRTQATAPATDTPGEDPLDRELDDAEAAMAKVKLKAAEPDAEPEPEPESTEKETSNTTEASEEEPEVGDANYAKWLKSLSPPAAKKIERQQKQIATLKATAAERIQIPPTEESPLAHVATHEELKQEQTHWETVRDETDKLRDALEQDPTLDLEITLADGRKHRFQKIDDVRASARVAAHKLNAVPDARQRLLDRDAQKPWEAASRLEPELFEKGSETEKQTVAFLRKNPQFKAAFPDWEVKLAHMFRSMRMEQEEKAGKAKHVRLELDGDGNVKMPRKATVPQKSAAVPRVPTAPAITRPALNGSNGNGDRLKSKIAALEKSGSDDDLRAAVAELVA
jgi:hypothetical protein